MNIMLFSRNVTRSGVGNHMKQLSEELVRQGHYVLVVSSRNGLEIGGDSQVEFIQIDVTSLNPIKIIKRIFKLHQIIQSHSIDIVHCHHRMAALYMKFYRLIYKMPMVYTLHSANVPADFAHRMMTYVGDAAIGVSTEVSNFLVEKLGVKESKVETIFNGVNEHQLKPLSDDEKIWFQKKWKIDPSKVTFVMHSRIVKEKNHLLVVEAVRMMSVSERRRIQIVCSGMQRGAYYERVVKQIDEYGLNENFVYTGWTETRDILGIADALLLPSLNEGFPLSVIEAFLMKVPVLRTRTGGYEDQRYCYELKSDDPKQVMNEMLKVEKYSDSYKIHTEEAYKYAMENFTVEKMTDRMVDVYKRAIALWEKTKGINL